MARTTAVLLLALSSLVPSVVSVPVLAQEECVCKPLEGQTFSNSSLASCNKIAEGIQQWRAVAFHSPYLADAFVDAEQGLRVFRDGKLLERTQHVRTSGCHGPVQPQTVFDRAVKNLFHQWKEPNEETTTSTRTPNREPILPPARPTWPWEQSQNEDKSPGREVQHTSEPAFLEPAQRYRILCRSRNTPNENSFAGRPELILLAGLIIVVVCMTLVDTVVVAWRGYKWATQSAPVALGGDEKRIYALYSIEEEEFEDAVVPAISDL
ncbi:hypothetical protein EG328_008407 [Venturia inaequalis]|uniref:Uncharacterized protein n=1 Tax=Venturia inaequalis TaxID=5025 RepID=A0A8H3UE78_VENIN|nr:hypothetical protein EG328_008407 [Venturia inaequalis]